MHALTELGLVPELWQAHQFSARSLIRLGRESDAATAATAEKLLLGELCATLPASDRALFLLNKSTVQEGYLAAQADRLADDATAGHGSGILVPMRGRYRAQAPA